MHRVVHALAALAVLVPGIAFSQVQPKVVGSAAELGAWDEAQAVSLSDDGTGGDAVAGDGLFTARVTLQPGAVVDYKIVPPGETLGGGNALGQSPDGGTVPDMHVDLSGESAPVVVEFRYADNTGTDWQPQRSIADSWNTGWSADPALRRPRTFLVAGDLQQSVGGSAWDPAGTTTVLRDDGRAADGTAGDGVASVAVATAVPPGPGAWKVALQGAWSLKLGADGWSFDPNDSANFPVDLPAFTPVRFELDLARGAARAIDAPQLFAPLLLSEILTGPTAAELVEIHNPSGAVFSLDGIFVSDDPDYHLLPGAPDAPSSYDFNAAFPLGAAIAPGDFQVVSLDGAATFAVELGVSPDYELVDTDAAVPDMVPAFTDAIGSSAGLTGGGEFVALYAWWDGDLVQDLDLVVWGPPSATNEPAARTDVAPVTDGAAYGPEARTVLTSTAQGTAERYARRDFTEAGELLSACAAPCPVAGSAGGVYNGVFDPALGGRADETSEPLADTWAGTSTATPGAPSAFEYTVSGTVVDGTGSPLEAVTVTAVQGAESVTAVTDASGAFELTTLTFGTWALTAERLGYAPASRTVEVLTDTAVQPALVLEASTVTWTVSGTVTDDQGAPLSGATVTASPGGRSATTGADGTYALSLLEGAYTLTAAADGYGADTAQLTVAADMVQDFTLTAGAVTVQVLGTVTAAADGSPLSGATVSLDDGAGTQLTATTGADGAFAFATVPGEATYTLSAALAGYLPATQEVVVGTEDVAGLSLQLDAAGETFAVSGTVTAAADGTGIAGATVTLQALSLSAVTTAAGAFEITGVPAGQWTLAADADGFVAGQVAVEVVDADLTDVSIALQADAGRVSLSGRVIAADTDAPIPTATVEVDTDSGIRSVAVGSDGSYQVGNLAPGSYVVRADAPGFVVEVLELELTADTVQDFALQREPSFTVTLSGVVELSDQPAGAWAGTTVSTGDLGAAVTAADGTYSIVGLQRGDYTVTVSRSGYATQVVNVSLTDDTTRDFVLAPRAGGETEEPGCGCASGSGNPAGLGLLLVGLALLRRRRS